LKFKAYKLTLVQALTENDKQLRTAQRKIFEKGTIIFGHVYNGFGGP
jgi:hypothetical protein